MPGVALVCVQTFMEFFRPGVFSPINGIFVDMPTYIRGSEEEKRLLTELVSFLPALRLKCHESTAEIRTLPFGTSYPGKSTPAVFVQKYCAPFIQRTIRTCERLLLNIPALLTVLSPAEGGTAIRTVTANISRGGCFLICFEQWRADDRGWLSLAELNDSAPVQVEVCWIRAWGEYRSLPGMGVRFIDLTEPQKIELSRLSGQDLMQEDD